MPVTVQTADHEARKAVANWNCWNAPGYFHRILEGGRQYESARLLQCGGGGSDDSPAYVSDGNGFITAVTEAYNCHHHLRVRPDDVWFSILVQVKAYITANAGALRSRFAPQLGQRTLCLRVPDVHQGFDASVFAADMQRLLSEAVTDKKLRTWIEPCFSTTTQDDHTVAAVLMMSMMNRYFEFSMLTDCGIPTVTLLGTREDWQAIAIKLHKLKEWGTEASEFQAQLDPILTRIVRTFDNPTSADTIDFWQKMVGKHHMMSGTDYYSGWITAFAFWDKDGGRTKPCTPTVLAEELVSPLQLDGITYPNLASKSIPSGWCNVPVTYYYLGSVRTLGLVAGLVAVKCTLAEIADSGNADSKRVGNWYDTLAPQSGWFLYEMPNAMPTAKSIWKLFAKPTTKQAAKPTTRPTAKPPTKSTVRLPAKQTMTETKGSTTKTMAKSTENSTKKPATTEKSTTETAAIPMKGRIRDWCCC